jgi:hypothetical protein
MSFALLIPTRFEDGSSMMDPNAHSGGQHGNEYQGVGCAYGGGGEKGRMKQHTHEKI